MNGDPRVMEFFPSTYDRGRAESSAALRRERLELNGYGWWVVEIKDGPRCAGVICLDDIPFEAHFTPAREIGWRFAAQTWGRGYATEGALAALNFAFERLRWPEVVAMTSTLNLRSQLVMQRLGMTHDAADDFDHPCLSESDRLRRHVLYRIAKP